MNYAIFHSPYSISQKSVFQTKNTEYSEHLEFMEYGSIPYFLRAIRYTENAENMYHTDLRPYHTQRSQVRVLPSQPK